MSKKRRKSTDPMKVHRPDAWHKWMGTVLTELRRSNAAGTHGKKRKDRYNTKREAIGEAKDD
jgi:hypothetical protein